MSNPSIELSKYLDRDEYLKYKARLKDTGSSTQIEIKTDIKSPYLYSEHIEFSIDVVKLITISKTKIDIYVNIYSGNIAKRVSSSGGGKWLALFLDINSKDRDCTTWFKSCCDDTYYLSEGDWVKVAFNENLLSASNTL